MAGGGTFMRARFGACALAGGSSGSITHVRMRSAEDGAAAEQPWQARHEDQKKGVVRRIRAMSRRREVTLALIGVAPPENCASEGQVRQNQQLAFQTASE